MAAQIASRLANDLQSNVVPRLTRHLRAIIHVFSRLTEGVKLEHTLVAVVLARPDLRSLPSFLIGMSHVGVERNFRSLVGEDVTGSIPSVQGEGISNVSPSASVRRPCLPSEAQIETTHEANCFVDNTHFLVLRIMKSD